MAEAAPWLPLYGGAVSRRLTEGGWDAHLRSRRPLIRPSVRTGAPSPLWGEGFGAAQIGRNCPLCGTFGYIYWEFGWSAPVGRRAARVCRPYGGDVASPVGASGRPRPTKGVGLGPAPAAEFGQKTAGAQCAPLKEREREPAPSSAPFGGTFPQEEGLGKTKRDRSGTCPLKRRGETQFRTKFLCLLSFSKKVRGPGSPPGPLTCVCCKGEGEMGDIDFFWVRSYHNRKIRRNRVRIMNFL